MIWNKNRHVAAICQFVEAHAISILPKWYSRERTKVTWVMKYTFNIIFCQDTCEPSCFKFSMFLFSLNSWHRLWTRPHCWMMVILTGPLCLPAMRRISASWHYLMKCSLTLRHQWQEPSNLLSCGSNRSQVPEVTSSLWLTSSGEGSVTPSLRWQATSCWRAGGTMERTCQEGEWRYNMTTPQPLSTTLCKSDSFCTLGMWSTWPSWHTTRSVSTAPSSGWPSAVSMTTPTVRPGPWCWYVIPVRRPTVPRNARVLLQARCVRATARPVWNWVLQIRLLPPSSCRPTWACHQVHRAPVP